MEASALQAPAGLARARISVSGPLLRLRSDDQLLALFRTGNDDAFRVIHDRYRQRLFAYTRQMLPGSSQDAEDALQDVFIRAYSGLRANGRSLALKPWLYRVAHNRCVDELRRPVPPSAEAMHQVQAPTHDPAARAEQRESLQRLIADLRRLPDHQRSALLMRELGGMTYVDVAAALDVSVPAVKSLLVRARIALALAAEARDTACIEIRDELTLAHDRGVRPSGNVRRHLADCDGCRDFRAEVRGSRRQFAALVPALGPVGVLAKLLGIGGSGAAGGGAGAAATGGASATTGAVVGGTAASVGTFAGATHVATLIAAAVVTAGGAVALQHTVTPVHHRHAPHATATATPAATSAVAPMSSADGAGSGNAPASAPSSTSSPSPKPAGAAATLLTKGESGSLSTPATPVSGGDNIVPTGGQGNASVSSTGIAGGGTTTGTVTQAGHTGLAGSGTGATTSTGSSATGTTTAPATGSSPTTATGANGTTGSASGNPSVAGTPATGTAPTGTAATGTVASASPTSGATAGGPAATQTEKATGA
jgi:RNA polymerase sigma factor (sigma-70 family)